jgi:hypothetical protein
MYSTVIADEMGARRCVLFAIKPSSSSPLLSPHPRWNEKNKNKIRLSISHHAKARALDHILAPSVFFVCGHCHGNLLKKVPRGRGGKGEKEGSEKPVALEEIPGHQPNCAAPCDAASLTFTMGQAEADNSDTTLDKKPTCLGFYDSSESDIRVEEPPFFIYFPCSFIGTSS